MQVQLRLLLTALALVAVDTLAAQAADDEALIANALSAAPPAVAKNATVMNWDMVVVKKGTNNFTCIPNDPASPTDDPMCVDENGLEWVKAQMAKKPPPEGKIGFGYMLKGETAASNTDPFAAPPADGKWSEAGPHVMIFNAKAMMAGYPKPGNKPDATQPFVMWQDTPYEHLMIPVPGQ